MTRHVQALLRGVADPRYFLGGFRVLLIAAPLAASGTFAAAGALTGRCQSWTVFCFARVSVSLPSGASSVMVEPAPMVAPAPMRTGATNMLPDPTKAPSPMTVDHLFTPS